MAITATRGVADCGQRRADGFGRADGASAAEAKHGVHLVPVAQRGGIGHLERGNVRLHILIGDRQPLAQRGLDGREVSARAEAGGGAEHDAPPSGLGHRVAKLGDGASAEDDGLCGIGQLKSTHPDDP